MKKRRLKWWIISCFALLVAIALFIMIYKTMNPKYQSNSMEKTKKEISIIKQFLLDSYDDIPILLDAYSRIKAYPYDFTIFIDAVDSELTVMYSYGSTYNYYYKGGDYALDNGEFTFSTSELSAINKMLNRLEKDAKILIGPDEVRVVLKEAVQYVLVLTTNPLLFENSNDYYCEPVDFGFFIQIEHWPRFG